MVILPNDINRWTKYPIHLAITLIALLKTKVDLLQLIATSLLTLTLPPVTKMYPVEMEEVTMMEIHIGGRA